MKSPRFNGRLKQGAITRSMIPRDRQWVQIPDLQSLGGATRSSGKRIFAIVSRPIPTDAGSKTIRGILIFDNHPESLRLVSNMDIDLDNHEGASRRTSIICGSILIAIVITAMLWPLFW